MPEKSGIFTRFGSALISFAPHHGMLVILHAISRCNPPTFHLLTPELQAIEITGQGTFAELGSCLQALRRFNSLAHGLDLCPRAEGVAVSGGH